MNVEIIMILCLISPLPPIYVIHPELADLEPLFTLI